MDASLREFKRELGFASLMESVVANSCLGLQHSEDVTISNYLKCA